MAIYKDEQRGTWYIDMRFRDSTGKVRSIKKRGFKSEQAAKREENRILREQKKEDLPVSSRPFKEIAYEYVDNKRYDLKETSYHNYKRMVDDFMPDTPIASLTSQRALQWRNKLSELRVNDHEYSSKTKNSIINLFISVCRYALRQEYIYRDPTLFVTKYSRRFDEVKNYTVVSAEEFYTAYDQLPEKTMTNIWFKHLVFLAFNTGARRAELKGLLFKDYDGHGININKSVTGKMTMKRSDFEKTKTPSSIRYVELDQYTIREMERFIAIYKAKGLYSKDAFIFGYDSSYPVNTIQNNFRKMNLGCRFHDLRHSHATLLIQSGVPINLVSKRLGHSDVSITLQVYTHALKQKDDMAKNTMDKINSDFMKLK